MIPTQTGPKDRPKQPAKRASQAALCAVVLVFCGAASAEVTPKERRGPRDMVIVAGGDVAYPRGWVEDVVARQQTRLFEGIAPMLGEADLAFVNVEAPLTFAQTIKKKKYNIAMHPARLQWLIDAGFNMFSVANNHTHDAGNGGIRDTLAAMERAREGGASIWWSGAAKKIKDLWAPTWIKPPGKSLEIAFFAFAETESALVPYPTTDKPLDAIRKARERADLVVVSVHSGREYFHVPKASRAALFRSYIDAGADLVIGHHPHVIQGVEAYRGGIIFHSLGNLSFASFTTRHHKRGAQLFGMVPLIEIRGGEVVRAEIVPLYVNNKEPWQLGEQLLQPDPLVPIVLNGDFARAVTTSLRTWTGELPGISEGALDAMRLRGDRAHIRLTHKHVPEGGEHILRRESLGACGLGSVWRTPRATTRAFPCSPLRSGGRP